MVGTTIEYEYVQAHYETQTEDPAYEPTWQHVAGICVPRLRSREPYASGGGP